MKDAKTWRGIGKLIGEAVEQGASAIERVHLATAKRPFDVLKKLPSISAPVEDIQAVHDALVSTAYGAVRAVTQVVSKTVDVTLESLETPDTTDEPEPPDSAEAPEPPEQLETLKDQR